LLPMQEAGGQAGRRAGGARSTPVEIKRGIHIQALDEQAAQPAVHLAVHTVCGTEEGSTGASVSGTSSLCTPPAVWHRASFAEEGLAAGRQPDAQIRGRGGNRDGKAVAGMAAGGRRTKNH
jgi:hypothetical protein